MIKRVLGLIFNRWVFLAIIFIALSITVWIVGETLKINDSTPLATPTSRWILIGVIGAVIALAVLWGTWRARRTNAAVVTQLMASPAPDEARESPDLAAVRERFEQAMSTLRRARFGTGALSGWSSRFGGRYVYELPWYLIIGAPGSGKTTALENCGLQFPLQAKVGRNAVRGVGGTRNCEWWFTDQAVLIDTAGRFTTQDSDAANDRTTWSGFLSILKRARPRQPINGVLVTVSVPDLGASGDQRRYGEAVRARIQELNEELGVRLPIYLVVTKCDLIAGFMDYFASLDREQRADAWGMTFPSTDATPANLKAFGSEFALLLKRLDDGLIDRLESERDLQRRARIYGFPNQFATLRGPLDEFLEAVFSPSPYEADKLLRGVYFISGTQEGTPIDRVMGTVARAFGLQRAVIDPNQAAGRSFFLSRLLGDVVFAERGIAGTNLKWERRRMLITVGAYAALLAVTVGLVAAWTTSYFANRRYVDDVARKAEEIRPRVLAANRTVTGDPQTVLPTLDEMRKLADAADANHRMGFGLSQSQKLKTAERNAYEHMLLALLLPSLEETLGTRMTAGDGAESQYEALKAYLMLHDGNHFDADSLKRYFDELWDRQYGRGMEQATRDRLDEHLSALLAQRATPMQRAPDSALVDDLRARIQRISLQDRVLNRMQGHGLGEGYPDFTAERAIGPEARAIFSGEALARKVPGLYSYDAYHKSFEEEVGKAARQLNEEQSWVLNQKDGTTMPLVVDNMVLVGQVRQAYLNAYSKAWRDFVDGIRSTRPVANLFESTQLAQHLSATENPPLKILMTRIARETTLTVDQSGGIAGFTSGLASQVDKGRSILSGTMGGPKIDPAVTQARQIVDDRFADIRALVTPGDGKTAPIDRVPAMFNQMQQTMIAADRANQAGEKPPASAATPALVGEARAMAEPVRTLLLSVADQTQKQTTSGLRANLSNEVRAAFGDECLRAFNGRYPFDRSSTRDVPPEDFGRVFGSGGTFDQLMLKLSPTYVDKSARVWRFKPVEGVTLADSPTLAQLQRASAIHDAFFTGSNVPKMTVTFKPLIMDTALKTITIDIDGQRVAYDHGFQPSTSVTWPALQRTTGQIRISTDPVPAQGATDLVFEGPWALMRMIDRATLEPTNSAERIVATINVGGHWAKFEIRSGSINNPLNMSELRDFKCPMGL